MLFFNKALGWDKEKFTIIGHSYGAVLGMAVKLLL
jgi:pimeloyl-ACP methyl ester carboxylesterase